uniref:ATP synthase complex subunit 8 n=1 Tax=Morphostenophanes sinicus TaxID=2823836 RepID=A0A8F0HXN3_9CUCU|nr:ATP synthase subunit 8 [Morphostenophanes sinicus]
MPQMAPLNWLTLMLTFVVILLMFNIKTFYTVNHRPVINKLMIKKTHLTWKW